MEELWKPRIIFYETFKYLLFLITHHRRGGSGGGDAEGDGDDGDLDLNNIDLEPATPEHVKPAGKFVFKRSSQHF